MKHLLAVALVVTLLLAAPACQGGGPEATPSQTLPPKATRVTVVTGSTQGLSGVRGTDSPTPVEVAGLSSRAASVAAGDLHTCVLTTDGNIWCWGHNDMGQLGDATMKDSASPVEVAGLDGSATAVVAGNRHACALTREGGVKCWGSNSNGQIGDGTPNHKAAPVDVVGLTSGVSAIASGSQYVCALTDGGAVKCWGHNDAGQLGDGTTEDRTTPVDVSGLERGVTAIAAGENDTCAVTDSGAVECWGANNRGQLGNNITTSSATANSVPVEAVVLTDHAASVAVGSLHTCVLTTAGGVKCWGGNLHGQLGDGTTTDSLVPVDVVGLTSGVVAIGLGSSHACALTQEGAVKCWGANDRGQLGDGTTDDRTTPVNVSGLESGVVALGVGTWDACAVTSDGGVRCWGRNDGGQLGNGELPEGQATP
jgi:alpha-tubulin suppressor-like RCC1 family protein